MKLLLFIILFNILIFFNGCVGLLMTAGTAVSAVSTSQEVEEDYDGDGIEYTKDKINTIYEYVKKKANDS